MQNGVNKSGRTHGWERCWGLAKGKTDGLDGLNLRMRIAKRHFVDSVLQQLHLPEIRTRDDWGQ